MASHHVPSADRIVPAGAVPWGETSPGLGMEEERPKDLMGFTTRWSIDLQFLIFVFVRQSV